MHHPDGIMRLMASNTLSDQLNAQQEEFAAANTALTQQLLDRVTAKQESMDAHPPVPPDKRPC
jgi:hypothetical protein